MFRMHVVQANQGDCVLLETNTKDRRGLVLIDGGPRGTFAASLGQALEELNVQRLDLLVLTHVDSDHVGGLLEIFEKKRIGGSSPLLTIDSLWHNSFTRMVGKKIALRVGAVEPKRSYQQGTDLGDLAARATIGINTKFDGGLVSVESAAGKQLEEGGIKLVVAGPDAQTLGALSKDWLKWMKQRNQAARGGDKPDNTPTNRGSIVLMASVGERRILLTGDARWDDIERGLQAAGFVLPLDVDVLKVQHHGSNRNATPEFFDRVRARAYVISADGQYNNPDPRTLSWIVKAAERRGQDIELWVTNLEPVRPLLRELPPGRYQVKTIPKKRPFMTLELG